MKLPVILAPEAQDEFDQGYDFYEGRKAGLGERFADAIEKVLDHISVNPKMHMTVFGNVRRAVVKGFPFCIYYHETPSNLRVVSVFHTSRDPAIWKSRS